MNATAYTYRPTLTPREKEVLACIARGLSSKQIADKLFISESTVTTHRKNMLLKTGAKNSVELSCNLKEYLK